MPLHGYHYMLRVHADIAKACGRAEDEIIVPDNGAVIEIRDEGQKIVRLKESAPTRLAAGRRLFYRRHSRGGYPRPDGLRAGRNVCYYRDRKPQKRPLAQIARHYLARICLFA